MAKTNTKTKKKLSGKAWAVIIAVVVLLGFAGRGSQDEQPADEPQRSVATAEPTEVPTPTPEPTPSPEPTPTPYRIHGCAPDTTVYVSRSNVIHSYSSCSGMKNYTEMTIEDADARGYKYCEHCW